MTPRPTKNSMAPGWHPKVHDAIRLWENWRRADAEALEIQQHRDVINASANACRRAADGLAGKLQDLRNLLEDDVANVGRSLADVKHGRISAVTIPRRATTAPLVEYDVMPIAKYDEMLGRVAHDMTELSLLLMQLKRAASTRDDGTRQKGRPRFKGLASHLAALRGHLRRKGEVVTPGEIARVAVAYLRARPELFAAVFPDAQHQRRPAAFLTDWIRLAPHAAMNNRERRSRRSTRNIRP